MLSSEDVTELIAEDGCGLLPDPWQQTGIVAATIANAMGGEGRTYAPDDFIPQQRPPVEQSMHDVYQQRRRQAGG